MQKKLFKKIFWNHLIRLFLEIFFDLSISALISLKSFNDLEGGKIQSTMGKVYSIIAISLVCIVPVVVSILLWKY
jgi:ABC-type sugar transport system permease subunit